MPTPQSHSCGPCLSIGVKRLREMQAWAFADKLQRTKQMMRMWAEKYPHCAVSVSGGKSSTILAHLFLATWPREKLSFWFGDTRLELPETYRFLRLLNEQWNLDLHWIRTPNNPWKVFAQYGWPVGGKRRKGWPKNARSRIGLGSECCRQLKHGPLDEAHEKAGVNVIGLGIQASESTQRRIHWVEFGEEYTRQNGTTNLMPLGIWTDEDIWEYHRLYSIPHSAVYDQGYRRNGCWACAMDIMHADAAIWQLEKSHPRYFALLMRKGMGEVINRYRVAMMEDRPSSGGAKVKRLPDRHGCFSFVVGEQTEMFMDKKE